MTIEGGQNVGRRKTLIIMGPHLEAQQRRPQLPVPLDLLGLRDEFIKGSLTGEDLNNAKVYDQVGTLSLH
jgi:hypothetical protein